jgi:hypothetical protein
MWSRCPDLNRRPTLYERAALPTELQRQIRQSDCLIIASGVPEINDFLTVAPEAKSWYDTWSANPMRARSEAGLSRLPVTEKIAGSNPVGPAKKNSPAMVIFCIRKTEVF